MFHTLHLPRAVPSRMKRAGPVAAATLALALTLVPAASAGGAYNDPAGDNGSAGDITALKVSGNKASGLLAFNINGTGLSPSDNVPTFLYIDSDANPLTGDIQSLGADYVFAVGKSSYDTAHWNGSSWVEADLASGKVLGSSQGLFILVNKGDLGNTSDLNFFAESYDSVGKKWDDAPNDGAFNYSLDADGPLINAVDVQTTPAVGPQAGKRFVVAPSGLKLPPDGRSTATAITPESYSCTAKLGAKALVGTGTGSCTFTVPKKKSRGKSLVVTLTVVYEGVTKSFDYTFRVR
jgi:hypothetical protein